MRWSSKGFDPEGPERVLLHHRAGLSYGDIAQASRNAGNDLSRWSDWKPNTPRYGTDNADNAVQTDSIVSAVSSMVEDISKSDEPQPVAECRIAAVEDDPFERLAMAVKRYISRC